MSFVAFLLERPYTVISDWILIALLGVGAVSRMPIDVFPEIDVPIVVVVWTFNGMAAQDVQNRILTLHERQLASEVDDIERIEPRSYCGVGVIVSSLWRFPFCLSWEVSAPSSSGHDSWRTASASLLPTGC